MDEAISSWKRKFPFIPAPLERDIAVQTKRSRGTSKSPKPITVRVSSIRASSTEQAEASVIDVIKEHSDDGLECVRDIAVVPSCTGANTFVALVDFLSIPSFLSELESEQKTISIPQSRNYDLTFDVEFLGLTQMYPTQGEPSVDIVFISGIGSHAYGSWAAKSGSRRMWPRHFLQNDLPWARVMIYGHRSALSGLNAGHVLDYARAFGDVLKQARREVPNRPIIFVAHSFGGNILKSFLVKDQQTDHPILEVTLGIIFFAVPHRGMDVEDMMNAVMYPGTSQTRLNQIADESHWRQSLDNFVNIAQRNCKIASFYETKLTKRLVQKSDGAFARIGPPAMATPMDSAILGLSDDLESKHPVDEDHSSIVKFENEISPGYTQTLYILKNMSTCIKQSSVEIDEATLASLGELKATNPSHDMKRIEDSKDALLHDCYAWILENEQFRGWQRNETQPILWIKGDPGKGKTMLMIALIRELSRQFENTSWTVTFFFCQNTDTSLNNAASILCGLIWKLVMDQPRLGEVFRQSFEMNKNQLHGSNALYALFDILKKLLEKSPNTILAIDALDECIAGIGRDQLIGLISQHAKASRVRWLLSSRNYVEIKDILELHSQPLSLELNEEHIARAVRTFVHLKVQELPTNKGYNSAIREEVEKVLNARADSTFLWVSLACKSLARVRSRKALRILEELPQGLPALYARMMEKIHDLRDEDDRGVCLKLLRLAILAFRPLALKELLAMAGIDTIDDAKDLVEECGSFVLVKEERLYFIHQSAKDYLVSSKDDILFPSGLSGEHLHTAKISVEIMSNHLEYDICKLKEPGALARTAIVCNQLERIDYACCFWADHFCHYTQDFSKKQEHLANWTSEEAVIDFFLRRHLLHWAEAMSILGQIDTAIRALQLLESTIGAFQKIHTKNSVCCTDLVHDALRAFRHFRPAIEKAPLQVYTSLPVFAPANSLVRKLFQYEGPSWISLFPRLPEDWNAVLQTLEGHMDFIRSVAFSPDGHQLVSGSKDRTVRLWGVVTGAAVQTFEGHTDAVTSVAFSPDGQQLVSGSEDRTVRLWDVAAGAAMQTLEGHTNTVTSVAFSPDGHQLVSGSRDRTVRLWDVVTGAAVQTFEGHAGPVTSVAFSPDGQQLVSGSNDRTVRLWDVAARAAMQTLEGHAGPVTSVAFSLDGQQLVSGSFDRTVRLWDVVTGAAMQTLEGHTNWVTSVAFSPDGQQLVSGSFDRTVRLWGVVTGAAMQTLEGHTNAVTSVAFSPDGQQLVSGSFDRTVRLWDVATGAAMQTFEGHTNAVTSVAFSPDGQQLVSGSFDETVRLWDVATGAAMQTLEGHTDWVTSVAFSPDGQKLVSKSFGKNMNVWDIASGMLLNDLASSKMEAALNETRRSAVNTGDAVFSGKIYGIRENKWITLGEKDMIWIPPEFRPVNNVTFAVKKNLIAVGCSSGLIYTIGFLPDFDT